MKFELKKYKTVKFELQKHTKNVPESELIADLISVAKKTGKDTVTMEDYSKYGKYSTSTLQRKFKSWFAVLEKAGLSPASPMTHPGTELHCDHILPWSKGGKTKIENLKTLCSECNLGKGNMTET